MCQKDTHFSRQVAPACIEMPRMVRCTVAIIFYDLETFGTHPGCDRIAEFAGILTDEELDLLEQPYELRCLPPPDYLATPGACLTTGITPQAALQTGLVEPDFARKIHRWFTAQEKTLIIGYNNAKFDDEFIRHLFYRTFLDPYGWHYQRGNRRLDLFSFFPALFDYYPDSFVWPRTEKDTPDFRLESLAAANDALGGTSHEALSDTFALRNLAKAIADRLPDVWSVAPSLLERGAVIGRIRHAFVHGPLSGDGDARWSAVPEDRDVADALLAYSSALLKTQKRSSTFVLPIGVEPTESGAESWWVLDLQNDPTQIIDRPAESVAAAVFQADSKEDTGAIRLINPRRFPFLIPVTERQIEALDGKGLSFDHVRRNLSRALSGGLVRWVRSFLEGRRNAIASREEHARERDVDEKLYDGFLDDRDRARIAPFESASTMEIARALKEIQFFDSRYQALSRRFIGRYTPQRMSREKRMHFLSEAKERIDLERFDREMRDAWDAYNAGTLRSGLSRNRQRVVLTQLQEHRDSVVARLRIDGGEST